MENIEVVERGKITVNIYEGQKGDTGTGIDVKETYNFLVSRGYLPNSSNINDVLKVIIDKANITDLFEHASLTLCAPVKYGDTVIQLGGIGVNGMVLHEKGTENTYTMNGTMQWQYPFTLSHPMDERSVTLEAIWQGEVKSTLVIPGVQTTTPVAIAYDPAYTNSEVNNNIEYSTPDDQLWLRQTKSPSLFSASDVGPVVNYFGGAQYNTVVLDLIAQDMIELSSQSSIDGIEYQNNDDTAITMVNGESLIIYPQDFHIHFNNLIVVCPDKPVRGSKSTIIFIAPSNIHVGTAVKGTTSVQCIAVNQGDVVQINISDLTVKILGTKGKKTVL
nr:MAG TPA: hypothetical protein [Caudoviricetes sp.]